MKQSKFTKIIQLIVRAIMPANRFEPLSLSFGTDRGTPVDRVWIEDFLCKNRLLITGKCLEITDNFYTQKFGHKITKSDVLDIDPKNPKANIVADLRNMSKVSSNSYNCVLLTHVLGLIDDPARVVAEVYRILKPGGTLLLTSSCLGTLGDEQVFWRFTPHSLRYLFSQKFKPANIKINSYGNLYLAQCFLAGLAKEDIPPKSFELNDPHFPCIVTLTAVK